MLLYLEVALQPSHFSSHNFFFLAQFLQFCLVDSSNRQISIWRYEKTEKLTRRVLAFGQNDSGDSGLYAVYMSNNGAKLLRYWWEHAN